MEEHKKTCPGKHEGGQKESVENQKESVENQKQSEEKLARNYQKLIQTTTVNNLQSSPHG